MSRNASGVYTLPAGNPVSAGTTIEATWANTTLSDIGTEITNSLSRTGAGGMTAALRLADGTSSVPGLAWGNETGSGFYRAGTGDTRFVISTAEVQKWTASGTNVTGALTVSGNTTLGDASGDTTTITGTAVSTPNGLNIDSNTLVVDATNDRVGVGTASPAVKLDINGDVSIPLSNNLTWGGAYGAGTPAVAGTANGLQFYPAGSTSGESMRLSAAGNLGIGTGSPGQKLTVVGNLRLENTTNFAVNASGSNYQIINSGAGELQFFTNGSQQATIDSSGNLGIGTTAPGIKLDVSGGIRGQAVDATGTPVLFSSAGGGVLFYNGGGVAGLRAYSNASGGAGTLIFNASGSENMRLDSSGNVGIGTSSPAGKLSVNVDASTELITFRSSGGRQIWAHEPAGNARPLIIKAQTLTYADDTATRLTLDSSGNLGLGVTPAVKLHAQSASSGDQYYFDTTDAAGSALTLAVRNTASSGSVIPIVAVRQWRNSFASGGVGQLRFDGLTTSSAYTEFAGIYAIAGTNTSTGAPTSLAFRTSDGTAPAGSERMRLDNSGNLGVGVAPTYRLDVSSGAVGSAARFASTGATVIARFADGTAETGYIGSGNALLSGLARTDFGVAASSGNALVLGSDNTERARITSGGDLLVGVTSGTRHWLSKSNAADYAVTLNNSNANPIGVQIYHNTDSNGAGNQFLDCQGAGNVRTQIRSNGGIANYSGNDVNLSDRREKTNFAPAKSYLDTICAIPVQTFNYIDQSEDDPGLTLGVVAQDVQAVAPELVSESNWGTEEEPKMRLSIYQTDMQYALMKCIQELKAQNDELRARVAALEA